MARNAIALFSLIVASVCLLQVATAAPRDGLFNDLFDGLKDIAKIPVDIVHKKVEMVDKVADKVDQTVERTVNTAQKIVNTGTDTVQKIFDSGAKKIDSIFHKILDRNTDRNVQ